MCLDCIGLWTPKISKEYLSSIRSLRIQYLFWGIGYIPIFILGVWLAAEVVPSPINNIVGITGIVLPLVGILISNSKYKKLGSKYLAEYPI